MIPEFDLAGENDQDLPVQTTVQGAVHTAVQTTVQKPVNARLLLLEDRAIPNVSRADIRTDSCTVLCLTRLRERYQFDQAALFRVAIRVWAQIEGLHPTEEQVNAESERWRQAREVAQ